MKLMWNSSELATLGFSELIFPVFPTTSMVAVGLLNTGKYGQHGYIVGDCRG
jgi:predicted AlkP superfamily pyrophosphatase or phosphodiesterase